MFLLRYCGHSQLDASGGIPCPNRAHYVHILLWCLLEKRFSLMQQVISVYQINTSVVSDMVSSSYTYSFLLWTNHISCSFCFNNGCLFLIFAASQSHNIQLFVLWDYNICQLFKFTFSLTDVLSSVRSRGNKALSHVLINVIIQYFREKDSHFSSECVQGC